MLKNISMIKRSLKLLISCMLLAWCVSATAQEQTVSFGDWAKICEPRPNKSSRCYLLQTVQQNAKTIMVVVIAHSAEGDRVGAMIDAPLGLDLPAGLKVQAAKTIKTISFEQCLSSGCRAFITLTDDLLEVLKKGDTFTVTGRIADGDEIEIPISPNGFKKAFEAL